MRVREKAGDAPISSAFLKAGQIGADYAFERTRLYSLYASEGKSARCADFTRLKKDTRITSPIIIYMLKNVKGDDFLCLKLSFNG